MSRLYDKLLQYSKEDYYPYHMPGHKRHMQGRPLEDLYDIDITEIDGFDNLHHAEGILKEIQERAAALWQTKRLTFWSMEAPVDCWQRLQQCQERIKSS